ncbi:MAG: cytochrome b/b6 domain-containing protein [Deltaproteobacteria bacterium]|nr:cytochrome b/b6 domain-containing protein [Deltaproteobacteria bacterium]MBN2670954.1 cytochrome b/b6 domain-containing protein [Deltaproteobacteria bacterium]
MRKYLFFALLLYSFNAAADETCLKCHDNGKSIEQAHSHSIHKDMDCTDCHTEAVLEEGEHPEKMAAVACGDCHDDAVETYTEHGRGKVGDADVPKCKDCHGTHGILPHTDPESKVHPKNMTVTCGKCHQNSKLIKKHNLWFSDAVETYLKSVHGHATKDGKKPEAAACNDCHSAGNSAHRILSPGDSASSINHFNIPDTCGKCHKKEAKAYWKGIHGKLTARGETDTPICTDCHGEHGILSPDDNRSPVNAARLAEATCSPCHESARLNEKFNIPTGRLRSFVDTYHGLKSKAGDLTVANCASCHGYHDILPQSDPESSIHPSNLKKTCSKCHNNIHEAMAQTTVHGAPGEGRTPIANLVKNIYFALIFAVIGSMIVYIVIDLRKLLADHFNAKHQVVRMSRWAVLQHSLLMLSFTVLCVTGFALRFSGSWWEDILFGWEGGAPMRGLIHRGSAMVFVFTVIVHVGYLFTAEGRSFMKGMLPRWMDVTQALQMVKYNVTGKGEHPRFGRFSYVEKAEYWALVWGTAIMSMTGFFLMLDNVAASMFPKGLLDVLLIIHYYEAWLALLAIVVWHLYSAVFRPSAYPMNPAWITGKMPLKMYKEEHPADEETIKSTTEK